MTQSQSISWDDLHQLFSVVMCIDESMSIIYASKTLSKCIPEANTKPLLSELFNVVRPSSLTTFSEGSSSVGSLCLLTAKNNKFAVRGQLLNILYKGKNVLCFCGAPWLFWINSNCPDIGLGMGDFSSQDVQLDQLFFMSTEKQMVDDLERVNRDLLAAKNKLEEAQDAQKQFFAHMSHEIRTPLNGVVSALSLLDKCPTECQQSQFVRLAQSASQNLMQVINYVLDVSKLELFSEEDTVFNCVELAHSTAKIVKASAEEKSLSLILDLASNLPRACYGDPTRLRQTLLNLLINAIKFTDSGSVTLRACCASENSEQCVVRFEVTDTGIGIADSDQQRVFEPFWSASRNTQAQAKQGTGLGLDIVRRNVEQMGGEICFSSTPGVGSTFWFELHLKCGTASDEGRCLEELNTDHKKEIQLAGKVLLVDDSETNLFLGSKILESLGLEVTPVDGGAKAVSAATQSDFDLVLMDIAMPGMNGLEATRQIRTFVDRDALPIVALTAHIDGDEKQACFEIGMNKYLTKPIAKEALAKELAPWLAITNTRSPEQCDEVVGEGNEATRGDLVDVSVLSDLVRQIGRDNLPVVINKVQAESNQRWSELEDAVARGDATAMMRQVHSLASIFRSVGLIPAGDALWAIEHCLRSGDEPAVNWLEELAQLKVDSLKALDQHLYSL